MLLPRERGALLSPQHLVNWAAPLNARLLSWWLVLPQRQGGATWLDIAGANHGTLHSTMTASSATSGWGATTRPGGTGELRFDGSDDVVQIVDTQPSLALETFTVAFWVYGTTQASAYGTILYKGALGTVGWFIVIDNLGPNLFLRVDTSAGINQGLFLGANLLGLDATWHHLVLTVDTGAVSAYRDGVFVATDTYTVGTGLSSSSNLALCPASPNPKVLLDDIRLSSVRLTATDIATLYAASRQGYPLELQWHRPAWAVVSLPAVDLARPYMVSTAVQRAASY